MDEPFTLPGDEQSVFPILIDVHQLSSAFISGLALAFLGLSRRSFDHLSQVLCRSLLSHP
jgi:hypothetical protein